MSISILNALPKHVLSITWTSRWGSIDGSQITLTAHITIIQNFTQLCMIYGVRAESMILYVEHRMPDTWLNSVSVTFYNILYFLSVKSSYAASLWNRYKVVCRKTCSMLLANPDDCIMIFRIILFLINFEYTKIILH